MAFRDRHCELVSRHNDIPGRPARLPYRFAVLAVFCGHEPRGAGPLDQLRPDPLRGPGVLRRGRVRRWDAVHGVHAGVPAVLPAGVVAHRRAGDVRRRRPRRRPYDGRRRRPGLRRPRLRRGPRRDRRDRPGRGSDASAHEVQALELTCLREALRTQEVPRVPRRDAHWHGRVRRGEPVEYGDRLSLRSGPRHVVGLGLPLVRRPGPGPASRA